MQMTVGAVKQVYKYRAQKSLGRMPSDRQTQEAFAEGTRTHASEEMFDEATNIQLGTEYMQYFIDTTKTVGDAYIAYRGTGPNINPGVYYRKISAAAQNLKENPGSMKVLTDKVK